MSGTASTPFVRNPSRSASKSRTASAPSQTKSSGKKNGSMPPGKQEDEAITSASRACRNRSGSIGDCPFPAGAFSWNRNPSPERKSVALMITSSR